MCCFAILVPRQEWSLSSIVQAVSDALGGRLVSKWPLLPLFEPCPITPLCLSLCRLACSPLNSPHVLHQIPCDPKMLLPPLNAQELAAFSLTSLERETKRDMLLEPDLGLPISMLDIGRYTVPYETEADKPPLDPKDAALLEVFELSPFVGGLSGSFVFLWFGLGVLTAGMSILCELFEVPACCVG